MKTEKIWLSFEVDRELHEFLKWYAKDIYKTTQKQLVNEILNDFKDDVIKYMEEIATKELKKQ